MLKKGAKHVISTKGKEYLNDLIAVEFTKRFYKKLFAQSQLKQSAPMHQIQAHHEDVKTVCEIFHETKSDMIDGQYKDQEKEIDKLIIKPDHRSKACKD